MKTKLIFSSLWLIAIIIFAGYYFACINVFLDFHMAFPMGLNLINLGEMVLILWLFYDAELIKDYSLKDLLFSDTRIFCPPPFCPGSSREAFFGLIALVTIVTTILYLAIADIMNSYCPCSLATIPLLLVLNIFFIFLCYGSIRILLYSREKLEINKTN